MRKPLLLSALFSFTLLALSASAQTGLTVRDVQGRLKPKSTFEPTKISVEDNRYVGIDSISYADTVILRNCSAILRKDLDFSPFFEMVLLDSFFLRHMELTEMTMLGWKRLGSQYLVKLETEFPRDRIRTRYRLFSVETGREIRKKRFEIQKQEYRALVHSIANDIVKTLTGDEGIYLTHVVYIKQIDSTKELFMADYDGYSEQQLTSNGSINISPAASPDGEYIFFTSYADGEPKLYMLTLKNGRIDLIANHPGINAAPAVSPDGKTVACVLSRDGNSEIYLIDRKGKIKKRLTRSRSIESSPTWSPDGKELAFTSDRAGSPQIYIMDSEGLNVRRLTYQGRYNDSPCWSPQGDRIIFVTREGRFLIASIDVTGKDFRILTDLGNNENPHFSPDGNHVIFTSNRLGPTEVYTMDLFGNSQRRLTVRGGFSNPIWLPEKK
ncbi:MAG: Tol-Pal system beta propeller repeat protein TolB [Candidatus Zixiibacteriota bacterium]|nr:MAG: Tol-Pal system beta propeller repeat protein TolB [candidate division Zixibacteria bacterium]